MHGAAADVVAVFGQVGQMAEISKGPNHAHGLVAAERFQQFVERLVGHRVGMAAKGDRELADLLDQGISGLAFLFADHIAQNATEQADVFYQRALAAGDGIVIGCGVRLGHGSFEGRWGIA